MLARTIARNSARVLAFVAVALLLFCAVYYAFAALGTLTTFLWSIAFPVPVIVGVAVIAFALMVTQALRRTTIVGGSYTRPSYAHAIPEGTSELKGWLVCIAAIDVVLSIVNYLAILHG